MILLDIKDTVNKNQEFTHISYEAILPRDYKRLTVKFFYTPKLLEDKLVSKEIVEKCLAKYAPFHNFSEEYKNKHSVKNHLTLSIDSPINNVGTAHRQDNNQTHVITSTTADYGFLPAKIVNGRWIFTVSVHCMVTESVDITLQAEVDDD